MQINYIIMSNICHENCIPIQKHMVHKWKSQHIQHMYMYMFKVNCKLQTLNISLTSNEISTFLTWWNNMCIGLVWLSIYIRIVSSSTSLTSDFMAFTKTHRKTAEIMAVLIILIVPWCFHLKADISARVIHTV